MILVWENFEVYKPIISKLVGVQRNGKRPLKIKISSSEQKELDSNPNKERYLKMIKASTR